MTIPPHHPLVPPVDRPPPPELEPIGDRRTLLVVLLAAMALGSVIAGAILFHRAQLLGDPDATDAALYAATNRGMRSKRLYELGVVLTGGVWISWQVRYVRNVRAIGRPTGHEPVWAIWAWFVPVANLVVPQWQLAVSARSSDPDDPPSAPAVLYAWWVACVVTVTLLFTGNIVRPAEDRFALREFDDFRAADQLHAATMAAACVTAILGICTVLASSKRQERLLAGQVPTGQF